ncbi:MAG TPA: flagellar basal body P-ring protein FlgI [Gemmatimonadaceae bacterium]|nr:flagellar basal body P-ring protein FlgI [Gemmatimonadaceae bacterium]
MSLLRRLGYAAAVCAALAPLAVARPLGAQETRIRDLVIADAAVPVRLVGYGIVTGLNGTGDLTLGGRSSGQTVQSVVNLLRRFDIEVPPEMLRTRNVAAVLVTAEMSPYLRAGGRFEVQVSSIGDARSLRGGVLWMTPLVPDAGADPVATAQGPLVVSEGQTRDSRAVLTTARLPGGGLLEADLPRPTLASSTTLLLREPDIATATRMAAVVDSVFGAQVATVVDPGAVSLALPGDVPGGPAAALARIGTITMQREQATRIIIDGRNGTVVAGGALAVSEAMVSYRGISLAIAAPGDTATAADAAAPPVAGELRMPSGTSVQRLAAALHAARSTPTEIAAILNSLRDVGALNAEVVIR